MKRFVWLNTTTGEFSNSWTPIDCDEFQNPLTEEEKNQINSANENWYLIEYECLNDKDFSFNKNFRLR